MQISVTGRHMEVTESLRDFAHERVEHELADFPRILYAHVILATEKHRQIAEVVVQGPHHLRLEAKDESNDMYASITGAVDKAAKQIEKQMEKWQNHKGHEPLSHVEARTQEVG
jgi:putative sigma-54 modulation protein